MAKKTQIRYAMSRRKRLAVILFTLFVILPVLSVLDRLGGQKLRRDYLPQDIRSKDTRKYHNKQFTVVNIVDGDTLDLDIADGTYDHTRVRLLGIDTPETSGKFAAYFGKEATAAASDFALGKKVTVLIDDISDVRDRYGRLLAYIVLPDGKVLNELLLADGFGYADTRFPHSKYDKFLQIQQQAIHSKAGLWKSVTTQQLPNWLRMQNPNIINNTD